MTSIYGMMGVDGNVKISNETVGREVLWQETQRYMDMQMEALETALGAFVESDTENYKELYKLTPTDEMDEVAWGADLPDKSVLGSWEVAYPLYEFGQSVSGDRVTRAKMTMEEYQQHIDGVINGYNIRVRKDILRALFDNAPAAFADPFYGSLTLVPLANGDGTEYPPAIASESERELDAYVGTNYLSSAISNTNNPVETAQTYMHATYGYMTGGLPLIHYINNAQKAKYEELSGFHPVQDINTTMKDSVEYLVGGYQFPTDPAGRVIGSYDGTLISVWDYIPANYAVTINPNTAAPLKRRIDPEPQLGRGRLAPVAEMELSHTGQVSLSSWAARFGFAVGNRLNGYVQHITNSTSYTIPTAYASRAVS